MDDCVRGRHCREPSRAARQLGQLQFHCGNPPPAAEPRTRTHTHDSRVTFSRELSVYTDKEPRRRTGAAHSARLPTRSWAELLPVARVGGHFSRGFHFLEIRRNPLHVRYLVSAQRRVAWT